MKTNFKITLIALSLYGGTAFAQVGMMNNNPDKSAILDLRAANAASPQQGLLIPNVSLTTTTGTAPISSTPANSLLVYNTNGSITGTGAAGTGYYYWDAPASIWKKLTTAADIAAADTAMIAGSNINITRSASGNTISATGDNLGNHTATQTLNMATKNIDNINNAYVNNDLQIRDRIVANTNYFSLYKNNGTFGIWNSARSTNDLSIDQTSGKTTLTSAQITKGTDNSTPAAGMVAMSADATGNVVWGALSEAPGGLKAVYNVNATTIGQQISVNTDPINGYTDIDGLSQTITVTKPSRIVVLGSVFVTCRDAGYTGQGSIAVFVGSTKYSPTYYSFFDGFTTGTTNGGLVRLGSTTPINSVIDLNPGTYTVKLSMRAWTTYNNYTTYASVPHIINPATDSYLGSNNEVGAQTPTMTILVYTR